MRRMRRQMGCGTARRDLVGDFPAIDDPSLLIGLAPFDDAAIYRVSDDVALVSTTDFFPPLVDDPDDFGAIAAANACSDVFAMGGRVVMAINVAAFPEHFPREAIAAIFAAGARTSPRPAAPSPAATRSATPNRSTGSPCRGRPPRPNVPQGRRRDPATC